MLLERTEIFVERRENGMARDNVGTHVSHCCAQHGCKYGDEDCPVVAKTHEQTQACESCTSTATLEAQIAYLNEELAWSRNLEAKGMRIYGYED